MSSEDLFEDVRQSVTLNPTPTSLGSTPIDCSGVVDDPDAAGSAQASQPESWKSEDELLVCSECQKKLKTKSGLTRHVKAHKINSYIFREPEESAIKNDLPSIFESVMKDMREEPAVGALGAEKRKFLSKFQPNAIFINAISAPIIDIVLLKKKVMPSAHFEEALQRLNVLLSQEKYYEQLESKLLNCVPAEERDVSRVFVQRFLWRFSNQLMLKIQEVIFKCMRKSAAVIEKHVMSDLEIESFKDHVGKILRSLYKIGKSSSNSVWKQRLQCFKDKFVVAYDPVTHEQCSISSAEFLNSTLWLEPAQIVLSDPCVNLFMGMERIARDLQEESMACTADIVFDEVFTPKNIVVLNDLRKLTVGILPEELSLDLLKELTKSLVKLSVKWDARKKKDFAKATQKTQQVATRSDLKRNPTKKKPIASTVQVSKECNVASKPVPPVPSGGGTKASKATGSAGGGSQVCSKQPEKQSQASKRKTESKKASAAKKPARQVESKKSSAAKKPTRQVEPSPVQAASRKSSRVRKPLHKD